MRAAQFLAIIGRGSKGSNALENTEDRAGATSEQQDNVINTVNSLDPYGPSWQLVPGNVAAGTVYAQVPTSGTGDLAFTRASTATRTNSAGNVVDVATGVPRIDYRNADGFLSATGRLLLERQSTNIALQSETFSNATWAKSNATISANVTTAPSGTLTADKLIANTANDQHRIDQTSTSVIGTNVFSVYAKKAELSFIQLRIGLAGAYFDLNNGTIVGISSGLTASIQDAGNNWYRCTIIRTSININEVIRINLATALNTNNFIGNGTEGIFIWGAQLEVGTYPTSYIPTTTAAVTRLIDLANKLNVSSIIGQTEGTLFVDVQKQIDVTGSTFRYLAIGDGTSVNRIGIGINTLGRLETFVVQSSVLQAFFQTASALANGRFKIALAYKSNDVVCYYNGIQLGVDTSAVIPAVPNLYLGHEFVADNPPGSPINQAALFTRRLTNAELAEITTL